MTPAPPAPARAANLQPGLGVALAAVWLLAAGLVEALIRQGVRDYWGNLVVDGVQLAMTLAVAWAARDRGRRHPGPFSPVWRALGLSMACLAVATVYLICVSDLGVVPVTYFQVAHVGFFACVLCLLWAILRLPVEDFLPSQRLLALLDGLLISTAIFFISWGGFLRPMVEAGASGKAFLLVYPILGIAMAALWVFQESRAKGFRLGRPGVYLRIGLGITAAWWPLYAIGSIRGWYGRPGVSERVDLVFLLGVLFIGLAALSGGPAMGQDSRLRRRQRQTLLTYLPGLVALFYGASLILRGQVIDRTMVVSGTLLGLVLTCRQYLTVRDLDDLSGDLERRVQERTNELVRSQQELVKAQRTRIIAGMAAGFAHDFKNMLGIILNWVELLGLDEEPPDLPRGLAAIRKAARQALDLVQEILAAGHLQELAPSTFDLQEFLPGCAPAMEGVLAGRATLVLDLDLGATALPVHMDREKLQQALVNLASNAADAMDRPGTLTLSAVRDPLEPFTVLSVRDDGKGIPPEILDRIFEPFFTTKPLGKGTGLGLSSVHDTVLQSGGSLSVQSEPGAGTVFLLRLPQGAAALAPV